MNCWRLRNLVAPFLDGLLSRSETGELESHLDDCPDCQELVSGVASLPPLAPPGLTESDEDPLMRALQAGIDERIAESIAEDLLDRRGIGAAPEGLSDSPGSPGGLVRGRPIQISVGLAAAYLAVALLLASGVVLNHLRVSSLETSLASRDALIDALQERLTVSDQAAFADYGFGIPIAPPVFLPAAAPAALPVFSASPLPRGATSAPGSPYRRVSLDGMPVIH